MPNDRHDPALSPAIRSVLAAMRRRIRWYIWLEGFALAVAWLAAAFWAGLALDYLPVLAGASEMPRSARAVLLVVIGVVFLWIAYRWVLRRVFVRLADHSLALVLERRFDRFRDGLVTAVEMSDRPQHAADFDRDMLAQVNEDAVANIRGLSLAPVFNLPPLLLKCSVAVVLLASLPVFYVANAGAFQVWLSRITLLSDRAWPRSARIAVVGVEVRRASTGVDQPAAVRLTPFEKRVVKVGKGADVKLVVHADAGARVVPKACVIEYATADHEQGRVRMRKVGRPRNGFQVYEFDSRPLSGVLSDIRFDVVGHDHRVRDFRIDVVDNPVLVNPTADCVFPKYMVDERLSSWLPRTTPLESGTQLPVGTQLTIRAQSNKSLREVQCYNPDTGETTTIAISGGGAKGFRRQFGSLQANLTLEITLLDADNVTSERPHRIFIEAIQDQPPAVDVALRGVSTMITPDAVIPVNGQISDDYGVAKAWFEARLGEDPPRRYAFALGPGGHVESKLDLREQRGQTGGLEIRPSHKLTVMVKASDKYDLTAAAHEGVGDSYQLEVVTPDELLAHLEARELALRQRFEQMIAEVTETRDALAWVKSHSAGEADTGAEPEDAAPKTTKKTKTTTTTTDQTEPSRDEAPAAEQTQSLQRLRVSQAQRQSQKSAQEVLGVAAAFRDIREELINNRVDTEDRKQRLQAQIAEPLQSTGETMFPEFDRRLAALDAALNQPSSAAAAADSAVQQANAILVEFDKVLQRMLELETFNELVGIVRSLLQDQQKLIEDTKEIRKKEALEFLR